LAVPKINQEVAMNELMKSWWMCSECENVFQSAAVPEICPGCQKKCTFVDVSCYIPECGGLQNMDVRLIAAKSAEARQSGKSKS
jgi:rubredoxin